MALVSYGAPAVVSDAEAAEMLSMARQIRNDVDAWLRADYPALVRLV